MVVLFGFLVQGAVLVFAAWATYVGRPLKNGQPMRSWAFPLTLTGTVLLCGGMFFCVFLVEQSTRERYFKWKKNLMQTMPPRIYWLQAGDQVVGDQTFDAFAHRDCVKEYTTWWKP